MGTACTWPPGPSCACSTWRPVRRSARSRWMQRRWRWIPRLTGCMSPTQAGSIRTLETTALDLPIGPSLLGTGLLEPFIDGDGVPVERLIVTDISVITVDADGRLRAYDLESGTPLAERVIDGATDLIAIARTERVVVDVDAVGDPDEAAAELAALTGGDTATIGAALGSGPRFVVVDAYLDDTEREEVASAIDDGTLTGVSLAEAPMVAVAAASGVTVVDAQTLDVVDELPTMEPATGLTLVERGLDEPTLYAASGDSLAVIPVADDGPSVDTTLTMPGRRPRCVLERAGEPRPRRRHEPEWFADGLRRGGPWQRGVRRRRAALRTRHARAGPAARAALVRPWPGARVRIRRAGRLDRRPAGGRGVATARHPPGGAGGRPHLPARAPAVRAPQRRALRCGARPRRGHALRELADRDERRLRDDVHPPRCGPLHPGLHGPGPARLDRRPPAHRYRHRARARARIEMGRALRGRRARPSRSPALGPRPLARAGRVHRDDRGPRRRRDPRTGHG